MLQQAFQYVVGLIQSNNEADKFPPLQDIHSKLRHLEHQFTHLSS